jgi:hypothetical protein
VGLMLLHGLRSAEVITPIDQRRSFRIGDHASATLLLANPPHQGSTMSEPRRCRESLRCWGHGCHWTSAD